jgi:apolipoprotein N-acyltransferase
VEQIDIVRKSTLLVNVTNDAWFGDSSAPHQHLDISRMRSLETGRPMLRATNDGVTALIAHDGGLLGVLPQFQPGVLTGSIMPRTGYAVPAPGQLAVLRITSALQWIRWRMRRGDAA